MVGCCEMYVCLEVFDDFDVFVVVNVVDVWVV